MSKSSSVVLAVVALLCVLGGCEGIISNSSSFFHLKINSTLPHFRKYSVCMSDDRSVIAAAMPLYGAFGGQILDVDKIFISKDMGETWNVVDFPQPFPISGEFERKYDWNPMVCSATGQYLAIVKYDFMLVKNSIWASIDYGVSFHQILEDFSFLKDFKASDSFSHNNIRHSMYVMDKDGDLIVLKWGVMNIKLFSSEATEENYFSLIRIPHNLITNSVKNGKLIEFRSATNLPLCNLETSFNTTSICEMILPSFTTSPFERLDDIRISMDRGGRLYLYQNSPTFVKWMSYTREQIRMKLYITREFNDYPENPHEVFQSEDGGLSWKLLKTIPRVNTVHFDKSGQYGIAMHKMYCEERPTISLYYSHDYGTTWELSLSAQKILEVGQNNKKSTRNGMITSIIQNFYSGKTVIFTRNDGAVFFSNDFGVSYSYMTGVQEYENDIFQESDDDVAVNTRFRNSIFPNILYHSWPQLVSDLQGEHVVIVDLFHERKFNSAAILLSNGSMN